MELRQYWAIVTRWWWLFVLCCVLGGGVSYLVSSNTAPTYEASALLIVGGSMDVLNPSTGEIQTSQRLAQTYAELLKTRPILEATRANLGLPSKPEVTVTLLRNTELMRITASDTDPERAAATANELAAQLILRSPSDPGGREQGYREFVHAQLDELQQEIRTLSDALLDEQSNGGSDRARRLQEELASRRATYSGLLAFQKDSSVNYIRVIEDAIPPRSPSAPKVLQNTVLAAVVGLMLAGGAAFLIEYLDDSIKGQVEVETVLGLATLGLVSELETTTNGDSPETLALHHPFSSFVEGFRLLRTRLRYSLDSQDPRTYLVTSVGPGEGKSTTVSNLAVVMAQAGLRTLAIDGDLRRPSLHRIFGLPNEVGLSSYIVGEVTSPVMVTQTTGTDGLWVTTSGPIPPNPAELLNSPRMGAFLKVVTERFDVVIIDSPPLLGVADASILSSLVSGTVLVAEVGRTRLEMAAQAAAQIERVDGKLLGVVLNRLDHRRGAYYYNYYYYSYYGHYGDDGQNGDGHGASRSRWERLLPWRSARKRRRRAKRHREAQVTPTVLEGIPDEESQN